MSASERNERVYSYVSGLFIDVANGEKVIEDIDESIKVLVRNFVNISQKGFREIVLTSICGMFIDNEFKATEDFYKCNPRSIYEGAIRQALEDMMIPCGKSGPLNVAKNADGIDHSWAKGKRPEKAAISVVDFLINLEKLEGENRNNLINYYISEMLKLAEEVRSTIINVPDVEDSRLFLAEKISSFVTLCPEGGAVPQYFFGSLLEFSTKSQIDVFGTDESVFGTNTTSKKPGDIWTEVNGEIDKIYEITVKPIDNNRLKDCSQNIKEQNLADKVVTFVCRTPDDLKYLDFENENAVIFFDVRYEFVDITNYFKYTLLGMTDSDFQDFLNKIKDFIEDYNRPMKTKQLWNSLIDGLG